MTYYEFLKVQGKKAETTPAGRMFLFWVEERFGKRVNDPTLFTMKNDTQAWEHINRNYGEYLPYITGIV